MNILIASKYGPHGKRKIGGVQTWVATVAEELLRQLHAVTLWEHGERDPQNTFDLGILSNPKYTSRFARKCVRVKHVCHGIIEDEKPIHGQVYFTSEDVRDHWQGNGEIIRQPIDLNFWSPPEGSEPRERIMVRFSYRRGLDFLPEAATAMGLGFKHVKSADPETSRTILRKAAVVIASGRAAIESMACGTPTVLCDHRSAYQGPLLDRDIIDSKARNYSGRGGVTPNTVMVVAACQRAIKQGSLRKHVEENHDVKKIVQRLIK